VNSVATAERRRRDAELLRNRTAEKCGGTSLKNAAVGIDDREAHYGLIAALRSTARISGSP